jgi:hypothetical protein
MARIKPNELPSQCPICGGSYEITKLHCLNCEVTIEGHFTPGNFHNLGRGQWQFIETFIRCRGKIKDVEVALDISYPTVVARLNEVIRALGFEVSEDATVAEEKRKDVLQKLARNELSAKDALRLLEEGE